MAMTTSQAIAALHQSLMAYSAQAWLRTGHTPDIDVRTQYKGRAHIAIRVDGTLVIDAHGFTLERAANAAHKMSEQWRCDQPTEIEGALVVSLADARAQKVVRR